MILLLFSLVLLPSTFANFTELTFELPDKEIQCFFEEVEQDGQFSLIFQVVAGGHYDVDCFIEDSRGRMIYRRHKIRHDTFVGKAESPGVYKFCFGNQFSTFTHKKVYFQLQVGEDVPIVPNVDDTVSPLTQLESACVSVHHAMKTVIIFQSQQRVRALIDRLHAEDIRTHVIYWATSETIILFLVTIGQVILLKSFFTEKRANASTLKT
ncbi:transmembrane emp24 domain-containing protein 3-like [Heptranchias perlo]|uniref:transmembrane emp24 domain-containing protein 3-like n=1 Tax=Heptranchias perlo TaxID=212740 RepID=UPI003559BF2C